MKKKLIPGETVLWAGSQESFDALLEAMTKAENIQAMMGTSDGLPQIWSKADGVATVEISGSLVEGESGWMRLFGVLGYTDINNALVDAVSDPEVKQVLLHINSGGGQVNGVMELSNTIQSIGKIKPIDTHTSTGMASAAYWLGVNGRHISAEQTALVGSIGVLKVHAEMSKQLEQDGINVTVMRSGTHKALVNKYEPLTEAAKAEVQGQLNDIYGIFIGHVAKARGITVSEADTQMGQGKEFLGKRALAAGLVDMVANKDKVISFVKKIDTGKHKPDNSQNSKGTAMKKKLNAAQLAAIEAGADAAQILALAESDATEQTELTPEQKALATAAIAADKAEAEAKAAADKLAADTAIANAAKPDAVVQHLMTQLQAANESVTAAKIEAAGYKAAAEQQEALLTIARSAVGKLSVALGGSLEASTSMDTKTVVNEHARLSALFVEKFRAGGVALATKPNKAEVVPVDPRFSAAVQRAPSSVNK